MQFRKTRYRIATIIGIVAGSIGLLCSIVSLITLLDIENFKNYYTNMLASTVNNLFQILESSFEGLNYSQNEIAKIMYISTAVSLGFAALQIVPVLVFSILTIKDYDLDVKAFQKRSLLHVLFIVSIALAFFNINTASEGLFSTILVDLSTFALIVAFFMAISDVRLNKKVCERLIQRGDVHERPYYTQGDYARPQETENKAAQEVSFEEQGKEISVEEKPAPTIKPELQEDMYELLAKLEKRYKNGEITEEDYRRMKKTILDNYLN